MNKIKSKYHLKCDSLSQMTKYRRDTPWESCTSPIQ